MIVYSSVEGGGKGVVLILFLFAFNLDSWHGKNSLKTLKIANLNKQNTLQMR